MPVSGLVLTLGPEGTQRDATLTTLGADDRVTIGELAEDGAALPVVTETDDLIEHEALWHELAALEGVLQVRLAFHDFSDVPDFDAGGVQRRRSAPRGG